MAKMYPNLSKIESKSPGEEELFNKLKNDPGAKSWTVIHSVALPNHIRKKYGESDFVLLIPNKGLINV